MRTIRMRNWRCPSLNCAILVFNGVYEHPETESQLSMFDVEKVPGALCKLQVTEIGVIDVKVNWAPAIEMGMLPKSGTVQDASDSSSPACKWLLY